MKVNILPLLSLLLIVGLSGCKGIKNSMRLSEKSSPWNPVHELSKEKKEKQDENALPETMAAIWADSVYETPGKPDVKGFGGRIFFYDENNTTVKADGELIIYGFDDSIRDKSEPKADRKFVFKKENFQKHYSENDLGGSYSVWVPWEPVGGFRKTITLIPMFKTADGRLIRCSQSISTLPGKKLKDEFASRSNTKQPYEVLGSSPAVVNQANYEPGTPLDNNRVANADYNSQTSRFVDNTIKTSTIRLTPSMSERLNRFQTMRRQRVPEPRPAQTAPMPQPQVQTQTPAPIPTASVPTQVTTSTATSSQTWADLSGGDQRTRRSNNGSKPTRRAFGQPGAWGQN